VSIGAFEAALASNASAYLAVVSQRLFFRLDALGKVKLEQIHLPISEIALGDGLARRPFRGLVQKAQQPVTFTYFLLEGDRRIRLELAALWGLALDEDGPKSFALGSLDVMLGGEALRSTG
jgi:hypothetical protein